MTFPRATMKSDDKDPDGTGSAKKREHGFRTRENGNKCRDSSICEFAVQ